MATKKKKYKKVYKGVAYIERALKKYFGKRYPTAKERRSKAHELFSLTAGQGQKVNITNIFELERHKRAVKKGKSLPEIPKGPAPEPYFELLLARPYYLLTNYPNWIERSTKDIYFSSKAIFPSASTDIQGGSHCDYLSYFAGFVNFCNQKSKELGWLSSEETLWYVRCNDPIPSIKHPGYWDCEIIIIDDAGNEESFGYNPEEPGIGTETPPRPKKGPESDKNKEKEPQTDGAKPSDSVKIAQAKAEQAKAEAEKAKFEAEKAKFEVEKAKLDQLKWEKIEKAMNLLESGKISEATFNAIINKL